MLDILLSKSNAIISKIKSLPIFCENLIIRLSNIESFFYLKLYLGKIVIKFKNPKCYLLTSYIYLLKKMH